MRVLSVDARATGGRDRARLARLIESASADVACVHRGPHLLRWRSICAAVGRRSGLVVVTGGRPAGANLLLSTLAVDLVARTDVSFGDGSLLRPAGAAIATLRAGDIRFVVVSATVVGSAAQRADQVASLLAAVREVDPEAAPAVICAYGAERPDTAASHPLAEGRAGFGRVFVDERLGPVRIRELDGYANTAIPPLVVDIDRSEGRSDD